MNRRTFSKLSAAAFTLACLPLAGCPSKTTIAQFVSLIGKDAAALATYFGQSSLAAQITSLASQIAIDITNWQAGSAATQAIQAITALMNLISTIPVLGPYVALIDLLLSALSGLLLLLPGTSGHTIPHLLNGHVVQPAFYHDASTKEMTKAQKNFTAQWDSLTAVAPLTGVHQ